MAAQLRQDLVARAQELSQQGHAVLTVRTVEEFYRLEQVLADATQAGKSVFPIFDVASIDAQLQNAGQGAAMSVVRHRMQRVFERFTAFGLTDENQYHGLMALVGQPGSESISGQLTELVPAVGRDMLSQQMRRANTPPAAPQVPSTSYHDGMTEGVEIVPPPATPESLEGRVIGGKYLVKKEIARGGMGAVLEVTQQNLEQRLAMKVNLAGGDPEMNMRFIIEAKATAQLNHPNIINVIDAGTDEGQMYMVMEYLDGDSLKGVRVKNNGSLEYRTAVEYIIQALDGLQHAHDRGILHRDIKPENLMLLNDGVVKVVDFGLAKQGKDKQLTQTGQVLGTPSYMPPEQCLDGELDVRTDVYSMGASLYELISGSLPYSGQTVLSIMTNIGSGTGYTPIKDALAKFGKKIPKDLEIVINKSLEREKEDRYESARAMRNDLQAWLDDEPIVARDHPWHEKLRRWARRNPKKLIASTMFVLSLTAGVMSARAYERNKLEENINQQLTLADEYVKQNNVRGAMSAFNAALVLDPSNGTAIQGAYDLTIGQVRAEISNANARRQRGEFEQWHTQWPEYVRARALLEQAQGWTERGAAAATDQDSLERVIVGTGSLDIRTEPAGVRVYAYPIRNENGIYVVQGQVVLRYWDADETDNEPSNVYLKEGQNFVNDGKVIGDGKILATLSDQRSDVPGQPLVLLSGQGTGDDQLRIEGTGFDRNLRYQWQHATNGQQIVVMQEPSDSTPYRSGPIDRPVFLGSTTPTDDQATGSLQIPNLPMGNYVLILEKDGFRDVRLHELVERNERVVIRGDQSADVLQDALVRGADGSVLVEHGQPTVRLDQTRLTDLLLTRPNGIRMMTETQINGEGHNALHSSFIYVPPGPFYFGENRELRWENGFLMGQYEVSNREWKGFVDAMQQQRVDFVRSRPQAEQRKIVALLRDERAWHEYLSTVDEITRDILNVEHWRPQWQSGRADGSYDSWWAGLTPLRADRNVLDWPVQGVSAKEARAYAEHSRLTLPTYTQWVKANGVDGRRYVWGMRFDTSAVSSAATPRDGSDWWNDNLPTTLDRSPFLIYDLSGNVGEITSSESAGKLILPGGSYTGFGTECSAHHKVRRNHTNRVSQYGARYTR